MKTTFEKLSQEKEILDKKYRNIARRYHDSKVMGKQCALQEEFDNIHQQWYDLYSLWYDIGKRENKLAHYGSKQTMSKNVVIKNILNF